MNTTGGAVNATVSLGGQQLTVDYGVQQGQLFAVSITDLSLNIGNLVTLEGSAT